MSFKKILYILGSILLLQASCSEYLDVNNDPNMPVQATIGQRLTASEYHTGMLFSHGSYVGNFLPSFTSHFTIRESDNYGQSPSSTTGIGNTWNKGYLYALKSTYGLISEAEAVGYTYYAGMGKVLKAYAYMGMVDLWGDIPYSEYHVSDILYPKADSSKDIYANLLVLLDEAIADLSQKEENGLNAQKPGADDVIYKGSLEKWTRAAKTLQLRLLVQSRKAKSDIPDWNKRLTALLAENNFIKDGEDFELGHSKKDANNDERHPLFTKEYGGSSTYFISPWLYETMTGSMLNVKNNLFEGIEDPRIPFYWVNQSLETDELKDGADYRDGAFISQFFATRSSYGSTNTAPIKSVVGIYACGGKYDDGKGGKVSIADGNGVAPERMMQAYSVPFLLAELYLTGEATGNARDMFEKGVKSSLNHVNTVSKEAATISSAEIEEFVTKLLEVYDAAQSNDKKLEIVMTQKWIANYVNHVEAYADIRRTGYPVLPTSAMKNFISPYKQIGPAEQNVDMTPTALQDIIGYPRVLWYPGDEASSNPNISNSERDVQKAAIFWDK